MPRSLALFGIGLVFGGGFGFVIAASSGTTLAGHDHADPAQHGSGAEIAAHGHAMATNLPAGGDAPGVTLRVVKDPMAGWNLHVMPQNFRFAPENASSADVHGEGHAHVYINGEKRGRLYADWIHLPSLPEGDVEIKVTLNGNSHGPLLVEGVPVEATLIVKTDGDGA